EPLAEAPLSVVLLEPDMATRSPHRALSIHRYTPRRMERPELVREPTTDALGIARIPALEPGSYIVCAPGATPSSPAPATARATLVPGGPPITRYVVEPQPTVPVTFRVQADFTPREGVAVRLVCRRRDGGARFRSREALVPGA